MSDDRAIPSGPPERDGAGPPESRHSPRARLVVAWTWDGRPLADAERCTLGLAAFGPALVVRVEAPYRGDPPPDGPPGAHDGLWRHEVVELFLAGPSAPGQAPTYLEVELSPHGHHLVLLCQGARRRAGGPLPLDFAAHIRGHRWWGVAHLPHRYLPPAPWRANAYAIHGPAAARQHHAAWPLPGPAPDFHQPELFPLLVPQPAVSPCSERR